VKFSLAGEFNNPSLRLQVPYAGTVRVAFEAKSSDGNSADSVRLHSQLMSTQLRIFSTSYQAMTADIDVMAGDVIDLTILLGSVAVKNVAVAYDLGAFTAPRLLSLRHPFATVYGDLCTITEPTAGCTFDADNGTRITVTRDPDFDRFGNGTNDMWYVQFDSSGRAAVYDDLGRFKYYAHVSEFAGYISGTTVGVGTSGLYWENVANGSYWLGRNGVLYSANVGEARYGEAVN